MKDYLPREKGGGRGGQVEGFRKCRDRFNISAFLGIQVWSH